MSLGHTMPFGAALEKEGVRFSLWAPGAKEVEVEIEPTEEVGPRSLSMHEEGEGWHRLRTRATGPGTRYRFRIDGSLSVPDPASRFQPGGVHGPSLVVDPSEYRWEEENWPGRPWDEAIIYELHVGTFTREGTFRAVRDRLDHLVELGVTAIELMPVADFSGRRGWGYDGVLLFAPASPYGTPADLKALVDAAHARGLMVLLDVVYNHFGPDGNFLTRYAPHFFTDRVHTPWGDAIDFSRRQVRDFYIHNAIYWLEEYRFDGLRLDAVHAIRDESSPDILEELAERVRQHVGSGREVHLVLENGANEARYLDRDVEGRPRHYVAQWNDDFHHACHVLATGERSGYYEAFADDPLDHLCRCLTEGFSFQGQPFETWEGKGRGEPSAHLPPGAFVCFLQNHDQIGNRAFGERLGVLADPPAVEALLTVVLLAPHPPLLFMGEEWDAPEPFLFFCDFHDQLAESVREGRRREFSRFPTFRDPEARERIPDPNARETFDRSVLDWKRKELMPHARRLSLCRRLIELRHREIIPRLGGARTRAIGQDRLGRGGIRVRWRLGDASELTLVANLSAEGEEVAPEKPGGRLLHATGPELASSSDFASRLAAGESAPWSVGWFLR